MMIVVDDGAIVVSATVKRTAQGMEEAREELAQVCECLGGSNAVCFTTRTAGP